MCRAILHCRRFRCQRGDLRRWLLSRGVRSRILGGPVPPRAPKQAPSAKDFADGDQNFSLPQAARWLQISQEAVYQLVSVRKLFPCKIGGQLLFSRGDLDRYRHVDAENEITKALVAGAHPLDIYFEAQGRHRLSVVERVMKDWAKLTGVWIVEGPRGSYARWLERFGLTRVPPKALRRFIEAMLVDAELAPRVRAYFRDYRALNGRGDAQARVRELRRYGRPVAKDGAS